MKIETVLGPAEIARLPATGCAGYVCVVFDILRATTSIVTALASGAKRVVPVATIEEALDYKRTHPSVLLGGERNGDRIPGFDLGNSPEEYLSVAGREIVTTTTNGTVALRACAGADGVLASSFLNMKATAAWLQKVHPPQVRLLCAGTFDAFALEDALAAGNLITLLQEPEIELCDASLALKELFSQSGERWREWLRSSRNAKVLQKAGRGGDIDFALRSDTVSTIAIQKEDALIAEPFGTPCCS